MMLQTLPSSCKKCSCRLTAAPYICISSRTMLRIIACHNQKSSSCGHMHAPHANASASCISCPP